MLSAVITQLKALQDDNGKPLFKSVDGVLELANISRQPINRSPAAFVVLLDDKPGADIRGTGPALQVVASGVAVIIALQSINNVAASDVLDPLKVVRKKVRAALFGWQPTEGFEPFTLGLGQLFHMQPGTVYWADRFNTEYIEDAL